MTNYVVNDVSYYVETVGSGEAILLLHGFTGDTRTWDDLVKILSKTRKCIVLDIIGHGKSDAPTDGYHYLMENAVDNIALLLDKLGHEKIDLLGYSMGGRLALAFALAYPNRVNKLILESASPGLKTAEERLNRQQQDKLLADKILSNGIEEFVNYWENIPMFASQKKLPLKRQQQIREQRLSCNPVGLANSLLYMGTGRQDSYWERLVELENEILYVVGSLDEKFCYIAEEMHKLTKNSKKVVLLQCGHAIHVEDCEKFGTIVSEFLLN